MVEHIPAELEHQFLWNLGRELQSIVYGSDWDIGTLLETRPDSKIEAPILQTFRVWSSGLRGGLEKTMAQGLAIGVLGFRVNVGLH